MDVLQVLSTFAAGETKVVEEGLPDGMVRSVYGIRRSGQPSLFEVRLRSADGGSGETIFSSIHQEEAAHIYACLDGPQRPWGKAWLPRGRNGSEPDRRITHRVFAAGADPEACLSGFADSLGGQLEAGSSSVEILQGEWEARFTVDGTGFKAGGYIVPGGAIMTSWK